PFAHWRINHERGRADKNAQEQTRQRVLAEQTLRELEFQRAQEQFAADQAPAALAHLAVLLRQDPANRLAAMQVLLALGQRNFALRAGSPLEHLGAVKSAQFDPTGQRVATGSVDGTARVWEASTGKPVTEQLRHSGPVAQVVFSPNSQLLATSSDRTVTIWEVPSGHALSSPLRHGAVIASVSFS